MARLKVGDQVEIIRGDEKGKRGKISRVLAKKNAVVVEGVNVVKRHLRATPQRPGGVLEVEAPIHESKVMPIDPATGKRTRKIKEAAAGQGGAAAVESGANE
jgi:large subunit ribosomal protein L24